MKDKYHDPSFIFVIISLEVNPLKVSIYGAYFYIHISGGNHFLEIQHGSDGHIWLMLHSGSRNVGKRVCDHYNRRAEEWGMAASKLSRVPKEWDLAYLPTDTELGKEYIAAMGWCLDFARQNRRWMMRRLQEITQEVSGGSGLRVIETHHNYAALEQHFGKAVWVHRKGAIRMCEGELGIIPGSMGSPSYIVEGMGNLDSFCSASHGAGRKMSRAQANKRITEAEAQMAMQGIVHDRFRGRYDEAPQAYKDIDEVMEQQRDLVKTLVQLQPLGVMKG